MMRIVPLENDAPVASATALSQQTEISANAATSDGTPWRIRLQTILTSMSFASYLTLRTNRCGTIFNSCEVALYRTAQFSGRFVDLNSAPFTIPPESVAIVYFFDLFSFVVSLT
jgi:hypothetical protein